MRSDDQFDRLYEEGQWRPRAIPLRPRTNKVQCRKCGTVPDRVLGLRGWEFIPRHDSYLCPSCKEG